MSACFGWDNFVVALAQSGFCVELGWRWRAPKVSMMSLAPSSGLKWEQTLLLGVKDDMGQGYKLSLESSRPGPTLVCSSVDSFRKIHKDRSYFPMPLYNHKALAWACHSRFDFMTFLTKTPFPGHECRRVGILLSNLNRLTLLHFVIYLMTKLFISSFSLTQQFHI